jgi:hypothetical protein
MLEVSLTSLEPGYFPFLNNLRTARFASLLKQKHSFLHAQGHITKKLQEGDVILPHA